jgi:hypothetical protein
MSSSALNQDVNLADATLKLSILSASQQQDLSPLPPPQSSSALSKSAPSSLVLFRMLLVFYHMCNWLDVMMTTGQSRQEYTREEMKLD